MPFLLLLLVLPLIEIAFFIEVGGAIGVWPTIGLVVLTAVIGGGIVRLQGLSALRNAQARLAAGEDPGRLLADAAMILIAGILLLTPGFFTDALGLVLLIPPVRGWLYRRMAPRLIVGTARRPPRRVWPGGETVEGEYEEVDPAARRGSGGEAGRDRVRPVEHDRR